MLRAKKSSLVNSGGGRWIKGLSLPRRVSGEEDDDHDDEIVGGEHKETVSKPYTNVVEKENFDPERCSVSTVPLKSINFQFQGPSPSTGDSVEDRSPPTVSGVNRSAVKVCGRPPKPNSRVPAHSSTHTVTKPSSEVQIVGRQVAVSMPLSKTYFPSEDLDTQDSKHLHSGKTLDADNNIAKIGKAHTSCLHQPALAAKMNYAFTEHVQSKHQQEHSSTSAHGGSKKAGYTDNTTGATRQDWSQQNTGSTVHGHSHHHHHHPHVDNELSSVGHGATDLAHSRQFDEVSEVGVALAPHSNNRRVYSLSNSVEHRHVPDQQPQRQQHQNNLSNDHTLSSHSTAYTATNSSHPHSQNQQQCSTVLNHAHHPPAPPPPHHHQGSTHHHRHLQQQQQSFHSTKRDHNISGKQGHEVTGDGKGTMFSGEAAECNQHSMKMEHHFDSTSGTKVNNPISVNEQRLDNVSTSTLTASLSSKKRSSTVHASCYSDRQRLEVSSASAHSGSHTYTPSNAQREKQPLGRVMQEASLHQCTKASTQPNDCRKVANTRESQDVCDGGDERELKPEHFQLATEQLVEEVIMKNSRGQRRLKKLKAIGGGGSSKVRTCVGSYWLRIPLLEEGVLECARCFGEYTHVQSILVWADPLPTIIEWCNTSE